MTFYDQQESGLSGAGDSEKPDQYQKLRWENKTLSKFRSVSAGAAVGGVKSSNAADEAGGATGSRRGRADEIQDIRPDLYRCNFVSMYFTSVSGGELCCGAQEIYLRGAICDLSGVIRGRRDVHR